MKFDVETLMGINHEKTSYVKHKNSDFVNLY